MTVDCSRCVRTLRRYQLMFRTALGTASVGLVVTAITFLAWMVLGLSPVMLPWGLLLVSLSGALALKVAQSTVRILEAKGTFRRSY